MSHIVSLNSFYSFGVDFLELLSFLLFACSGMLSLLFLYSLCYNTKICYPSPCLCPFSPSVPFLWILFFLTYAPSHLSSFLSSICLTCSSQMETSWLAACLFLFSLPFPCYLNAILDCQPVDIICLILTFAQCFVIPGMYVRTRVIPNIFIISTF